jgi:hypothetical protein
MAAPMVEYQKVMAEIVYINLPAPEIPHPGMSGSELFHGFLGEFERATNPEVKAFVNAACLKWNIQYRTTK